MKITSFRDSFVHRSLVLLITDKSTQRLRLICELVRYTNIVLLLYTASRYPPATFTVCHQRRCSSDCEET